MGALQRFGAVAWLGPRLPVLLPVTAIVVLLRRRKRIGKLDGRVEAPDAEREDRE